jgi:hypothetical protein
MDFQTAVKEFAEGLAGVINNAPPWSAEWERAEWTDDVIERRSVVSKPTVQQPTLD